jgi:hypothetical protein
MVLPSLTPRPQAATCLAAGAAFAAAAAVLALATKDTREDPARHAAGTGEDQPQHAAGLETTLEMR